MRAFLAARAPRLGAPPRAAAFARGARRALAARAARAPPAFVCTSCGADSGKWHGKCAACGELNTVVEFKGGAPPARGGGGGTAFAPWMGGAAGGAAARLTPLDLVPRGGAARASLGSVEIDRLLGGGLTRGSATL